MKAKDLRERSTEDLSELEKSIAAERFQSKFKNFTNRLDDTSQIRKAKRDLARVKLILGERARTASTAAAADKPVVAAQSVAASAPVTAPSAAAAEPESTGTVTEAAPKRASKKSKAETAPDAPAAGAPAAGAPAASTAPAAATAPAKKAKSKSTEQGESK